MGSPRPDRSMRVGADWPWIAAVVVVALIAAWPAVSQPGLLNTRGGGDSPFLLQRLHQLTAALAGGHFPVRWMPDANYGYGYPFYNYYAPLSIYVAAAFRFLGFSYVRAIHLAQIAGFIVAGLGMFHLGRRWLGSRWAGLLAAVAYTVAPFHMVNVYVRGDSLAEFWAMAFYPWVLLAADGLLGATTDRRRLTGSLEIEDPYRSPAPRPRSAVGRRLSLFALAYAALILSHNISALIFSPFLLLYLVAGSVWQATADGRPPRQSGEAISRSFTLPISTLLIASTALLLALALAAWFFVPALAEQDLAQLGPVTEGYFHYSNHFRGRDLAQGGLIFDYNPDGGVAFRLSLGQLGLAIAGAVVLVWRRAQGSRSAGKQGKQATGNDSPLVNPRALLAIPLALLAVFMITPLSRPLWDHLPLLPFTQFPWRFLSVASFFMALLSGGLVLVTDRPAARAAIALTAGLVLLAAGLLGLRVDHLILTDADVTAERLAQYEWFTGNIGTTVSAEYLTPESSPRPWTSAWLNTGERDRIIAPSGELNATDLPARQATHQIWRVATGADGAELVFPTMQWAGWRAIVNGQPAELRALPSSGLMALTVAAGEHEIVLELGRTPVRLVAEVISVVAGLVTAGLLFTTRRSGPQGSNLPTSHSPALFFRGLPSIVCGLLLLAALAFAWRSDPRALPPGDLTWDFAQMGYLHHTPGGVPFSDGARLYEYGYSADALTAGEMLTVTLSVAPGDGRATTLGLVTPASARPAPDGMAEPPVLAAATQPLDGETIVFMLPIPFDAPPGLYIPRLTIDGTRALTPSGAARGDLFLRPIRVSGAVEQDSRGAISQSPSLPGPAEPPLPSPMAGLDVRTLALSMRDAMTLDGRFAWYTDRALGTRYQFSWRLQDEWGGILTQLDAQPGYGYQPSTGWKPGQWTVDWLALRLPDVAPAEGEYPLVMRLYDAGTGETVLTRRVGVVSWDGGAWQPRLHEPSFLLPNGLSPLSATFGPATEPLIALRGYQLARAPGSLRLTLYWEALTDVVGEYTRFVHLSDVTGIVAAQVDGAPAGDSYPTDQWVAGEIVADTVAFDLSVLPPGEYRLATGFYRPMDLSRLSAFGPDGPLPDGSVLLPEFVVNE